MNAQKHASKNYPFIQQKYALNCFVFALLSLLISAMNLWQYGFNIPNALAPILTCGFALIAWLDHAKPLKALSTIESTLDKARAGNTYVRITNTKGLGEVGKVAWALNDFLDIIE